MMTVSRLSPPTSRPAAAVPMSGFARCWWAVLEDREQLTFSNDLPIVGRAVDRDGVPTTLHRPLEFRIGDRARFYATALRFNV
jgi:hypothetical protein